MRLGLHDSQLGAVGVNIPTIFEALTKLPQTQKDVQQIAKTSAELQSPELKQQIATIASQVENLSVTMLVLNALSTAAMVGLFILQLREARK